MRVKRSLKIWMPMEELCHQRVAINGVYIPMFVGPPSSGSAMSISTAPSHHQPPGLLVQHHQGAVQGLNFPSQTSQVATVSGSSYPHQPSLPSNSGGVFLNQPNHGAPPGGMYVGGHPQGYFRPQQQPLNPPPPGNQGGGPGHYRPRRPHPPNIGGNSNPYY